MSVAGNKHKKTWSTVAQSCVNLGKKNVLKWATNRVVWREIEISQCSQGFEIKEDFLEE